MKSFAVGIVTLNRWDLTKQTLDGLVGSDQPLNSYDLFLIDNGSSTEDLRNLKEYVKTSSLPVKNLIAIEKSIMSKAWNLFLSLTADYPHRVKLDNDILLSKAKKPEKKVSLASGMSPEDFGSNPGAIKDAGPIRGLGAARRISENRKRIKELKSKKGFLTNLLDFSRKNNTDITSLITMPLNGIFPQQYNKAITNTYKGLSFLSGGCMMISKKCFDTLGYFHEHLPRGIDIEYSQRALRSGLNIGYHPHFYAIHIGFDNPTEGKSKYQSNIQEFNLLEATMPIEAKGESEWTIAISPIKSACEKNKVLHLI